MRRLTTQTKRLVGITLMLASVLLSVANPTPLAAMSSADVPAGNSSGSARLSQPGQTTHARVFQDYSKLPLYFEANQGQTDSQVKFLLRSNRYTLFLTPTEAVLTLRNAEGMADGRTRPTRNDEFKNPHLSVIAHQSSFNTETVLRMKLVDANLWPHVAGLEELPGKVNSFIGNHPTKWRTNIPTYAKVKYEDVYPGVDVIYYGNQRQLEHDFVVTAGVDPQVIMLEFEGANTLEVNSQGNLILHTVGGETLLQKPTVYQEVAGVRKEISGGYVLRGKHRVGFAVGRYDATRPLVIDPILVYSTYLGGGGEDQSVSIAVDSSANAYVTGFTSSVDFPTTLGAFQTAGSLPDAFVTKLNATGSALVYSTYLGGNGGEEGFSLTVDSSGNAYVTGGTNSSNFPTTPGAFQTTFRGGDVDAFVTNL